jgi:hypothetical protein
MYRRTETEMSPYLMQAVATERVRDMHRAAADYRRAALARGSRPSRPSWPAATATSIARSLTSVRNFVRREQLGAVNTYCATC